MRPRMKSLNADKRFPLQCIIHKLKKIRNHTPNDSERSNQGRIAVRRTDNREGERGANRRIYSCAKKVLYKKPIKADSNAAERLWIMFKRTNRVIPMGYGVQQKMACACNEKTKYRIRSDNKRRRRSGNSMSSQHHRIPFSISFIYYIVFLPRPESCDFRIVT